MISLPFASEFDFEQALIDRYESENLNSDFDIELPSEIQHCSPTRIGDFLAGRKAAAVALQRLGKSTFVSRNERGLPIWPNNTLGSISHTSDFAWAAVGENRHADGIGIDCEKVLEAKVA